VVRINSPGWTGIGAIAILKKYGRSTDLITHKSPNSGAANFEVVFPRKPLSLFMPARLKLATPLANKLARITWSVLRNGKDDDTHRFEVMAI